MEASTIKLLIPAVIVALAAVMIAVRYISPAPRREAEAHEATGMDRTKLAIKLIALGLVLLAGLAVYFLYARGGG